MRHNFDYEGRCYFCRKKWAEVIGTQCKGWLTDPEEADSVLNATRWTPVPRVAGTTTGPWPSSTTEDRPRSP